MVKIINLVLFLLVFVSSVWAENPSYHIFKNAPKRDLTVADRIIGSSLLAVEYVAVPLVMKNAWWENGFELRNPFKDLTEMEPYHVDESWHAAMNYLTQDLHYTVLRRFFGIESPWPSAGLTFFSWTTIEVLDAMEKDDRWGFSVNDEIGNVFGIGVWLVHHYYPDFKFYIRGGIRQWGEFGDYAKNMHKLITDSDEYYSNYGVDKYELSKVEYIYKFYDEFYSGVAISKDKHNHDIYGFTIGWDGISFANNHSKGWWNYPARLFGASFSLSVSLTIWADHDNKLTFF